MSATLKTKLTRAETNSWPIEQAGLPPRVRHMARKHGLSTLGELRRMKAEETLNWRSVGIGSLRAMDVFWKQIRQLEAGTTRFATVREWLDAFLEPKAVDVLARRYGAYPLINPRARARETLVTIGNDLNITRERVRQLQHGSLAILRQELPRAYAAPFLQAIVQRLKEAGGVLTMDDLAQLPPDPLWSGLRLEGLWRLLLDVNPGPVAWSRGLLTIIPAADRAATDDLVAARCAATTAPVPLADLHAHLRAHGHRWKRVALATWLDHDDRLWAFTNNDYLWRTHGVTALLDTYTPPGDEAINFRALTEKIIARLKPPQTISPFIIIRALSRHPHWVAVATGEYRLTT